MDSYWASVLEKQVSRRRALAATGATTIGGALLAACGGGGSSTQSQTKDRSGFLAEPVDTSSQAVAGGIMEDSRAQDPTTLDVILNNSSLAWNEMYSVYGQLAKAGIRSNKSDAFEGDSAQSWEISPDGTQVSFKMRPNLKFDPRPPTNGRAMTTEDVKWSFDRFANLSPYRNEVFHSLSQAAPIDSYSFPDDKTVVLKLAFPYASIIEMVGFAYYLYIMPKEGETFDLRSQMRGTGPFRLMDYQPSVGLKYARNPDWYVPNRPFLAGFNRTIIPDYAAGLAQFEAKNIWTYAVNQEDILRVKRDHQDMVMLQVKNVGTSSLASTPYIAFSQRGESNLRDVRLRRAASMSIDRDAWIDTIYNVEAFKQAGMTVETLWNSHMPTGAPDWMDPRSGELGEGAQYFKYNPAEAKKLLSAAGYTGSAPITYYYHNQTLQNAKQMEAFAGMLKDSGFNLDTKVLDYNSEWRQTCQLSAGSDYSGFCFNNSGGFNQDAYFVAKYTVGGKYAVSTRPTESITDMVLQARRELDASKRSALFKDIQRRAAVDMPDIPFPGLTYQFSLRWPWLKNHGVFVTGGASSREPVEYWYDAKAKT